MPPDNLVYQVLQMIAQQQRDMHAENKNINEQTLDAVSEIKDDVHKITVEVAVWVREISDIKAWRKDVVDPHIDSVRETRAQLTGATKLARWMKSVVLLACGGGLYKVITSAGFLWFK